MSTRDLLAGASFLISCLAIHPGILAQRTTVPPGYVLQWSDDFQETVLDTSKWNYRTDSKAFSVQTPANISLDHAGHMNIALRREDMADKHFTGGGIISKESFRYGYYEVQAKLTRYPGWHTAFWMFAGDGRTVPPVFPPNSNAWTEIDDMEVEGLVDIDIGAHAWQHGQHVQAMRCNSHYRPGFDMAGAYHTYGMEWTEQKITYYIDGKDICSQQFPTSESPHDRLNIWLTAIGFKGNIAVGDEPSPASFGRVAFYVRDYYIASNEPGYAEYGGGWIDSRLSGSTGMGSRMSCDTHALAVWTPTILVAGKYAVEIYKTVNPRHDAASKVTIRADGHDTARVVDFSSGQNGWVDLGTYDLAAGSGSSVSLANSTHGCSYADMVKFVRK